MMHNVGKTDKIIRALLAAIIILISMLTGMPWITFFALIPLLTIFFSFCPLYVPFKISTIVEQKINLDENKTITIKQEDLAPKKEETTIAPKIQKNRNVIYNPEDYNLEPADSEVWSKPVKKKAKKVQKKTTKKAPNKKSKNKK